MLDMVYATQQLVEEEEEEDKEEATLNLGVAKKIEEQIK